MYNLTSLLERFSKLLNKDTALKGSVIGVVKERTGATLSPENINLKEGVLEITASQAVKNEIRLKEDLIRTELKEVYKINILRIFYK
ncbi:MAG: hypothetical protein NUV78_02490 [Candidatus Zambryskibacteria bacterium]|nr:hypothetical protein [Candidatus Zambryskibacteria bacterium]